MNAAYPVLDVFQLTMRDELSERMAALAFAHTLILDKEIVAHGFANTRSELCARIEHFFKRSAGKKLFQPKELDVLGDSCGVCGIVE